MSLLPLLDAINDLKRLPRMGWLLAGVAPAESVADHAYATAMVALLLTQTINLEPAAAGLAAPLDVARVLQIALVHDLPESTLTDLPHRATALLGANAKHDAERTALLAMTANLPVCANWLDLWEEYNAAASPEARLVRDADKLELAHQALRYTHSGRRGLDDFVTARDYTFACATALYAEIAAAYADARQARA